MCASGAIGNSLSNHEEHKEHEVFWGWQDYFSFRSPNGLPLGGRHCLSGGGPLLTTHNSLLDMFLPKFPYVDRKGSGVRHPDRLIGNRQGKSGCILFPACTEVVRMRDESPLVSLVNQCYFKLSRDLPKC